MSWAVDVVLAVMVGAPLAWGFDRPRRQHRQRQQDDEVAITLEWLQAMRQDVWLADVRRHAPEPIGRHRLEIG